MGLTSKEIRVQLVNISSKVNEHSSSCFKLQDCANYMCNTFDPTFNHKEHLKSGLAERIVYLMDENPEAFYSLTGLKKENGIMIQGVNIFNLNAKPPVEGTDDFTTDLENFSSIGKVLYHLPLCDVKGEPHNINSRLIKAAGQCAIYLNRNITAHVSVFCENGLERTATFICAAEFIRRCQNGFVNF